MEKELINYIENNLNEIIENIFLLSSYHIEDKKEIFKKTMNEEEIIELLKEKILLYYNNENIDLNNIETENEELFGYLAEELFEYLENILEEYILNENITYEE